MLGLFKSKKKTTHAKILIVDDETDVVNSVKYHLKSYEFEVATASNGKEGLEKAVDEKPDLILLDISMPVMDGYEMLERLRNHPDIKNTPVIMFTAYSEITHVAMAAGLGIEDYVTKPFDFTDLMDKITCALENKNNGNA